MKKIIRFKTEEEFIKEFGIDYWDKIPNGWVDEMKHLFGKSPGKYQKEFLQLAVGHVHEVVMDYYNNNWYISREMITFI